VLRAFLFISPGADANLMKGSRSHVMRSGCPLLQDHIPGPEARGTNLVVTLPTLGLPADITREYLRSPFIGRDSLIRFQELYQEAGAWVDAWEKSGVEHAEMAADHEEEPDGGDARR
jgi:hypothetical protein